MIAVLARSSPWGPIGAFLIPCSHLPAPPMTFGSRNNRVCSLVTCSGVQLEEGFGTEHAPGRRVARSDIKSHGVGRKYFLHSSAASHRGAPSRSCPAPVDHGRSPPCPPDRVVCVHSPFRSREPIGDREKNPVSACPMPSGCGPPVPPRRSIPQLPCTRTPWQIAAMFA